MRISRKVLRQLELLHNEWDLVDITEETSLNFEGGQISEMCFSTQLGCLDQSPVEITSQRMGFRWYYRTSVNKFRGWSISVMCHKTEYHMHKGCGMGINKTITLIERMCNPPACQHYTICGPHLDTITARKSGNHPGNCSHCEEKDAANIII